MARSSLVTVNSHPWLMALAQLGPVRGFFNTRTPRARGGMWKLAKVLARSKTSPIVIFGRRPIGGAADMSGFPHPVPSGRVTCPIGGPPRLGSVFEQYTPPRAWEEAKKLSWVRWVGHGPCRPS